MAENILNVKIKQRCDTEANWSSANPVLLKGEIAISSDKKMFKVGDGTSTWSALSYNNANSSTTATALTVSAGSATQPVYFSNGKPVNTTYSLGKSVPSNAVFTDTHYTTGLKVGASSTATANAAATNGNVYLNVLDNTTIRDSHKIVGSGATTVTSDANGVITISSTDTNTNTTYSTGTSSTSGLTKLYTTTGTATDGTMTQNAITTQLNNKTSVTIVRWS